MSYYFGVTDVLSLRNYSKVVGSILDCKQFATASHKNDKSHLLPSPRYKTVSITTIIVLTVLCVLLADPCFASILVGSNGIPEWDTTDLPS